MEKHEIYQVRLGGLGGQGVILGSKILGDALSREGYRVLQTQSYGIEARGGASCGEVLYAEGEINSLRVWEPNVLLVLAGSALEAYKGTVKDGGYVFYDSYQIPEGYASEKQRVIGAPFTEIAVKELGGEIYTNLIALGFINGVTKMVSEENLEKALCEQIKANQENNCKALRRGYEEAAKVEK